MTQQIERTEKREARGIGVRILLTFLIGLGAIVFGPFIAVYMLPTAIAALRRHSHLKAIAITNALVGWTLIGWIAMMGWVLWSLTEQDHRVIYRDRQP